MTVDAGKLVGDILRADGTVTASVYTDRIPQKFAFAVPAVRVSVLSGEELYGIDSSAGVHRQRVQVDVIAKSRLAASAEALLVQAALNDYTGTVDSHVVQHIHPLNDFRYQKESPRDGSPNYRHISTRSYMVTAND